MMLSDEVEYLGERPGWGREASVRPFQQALTGLKLHVEKCGSEPPYTLTFLKSRTPIVNIGRKSGTFAEGGGAKTGEAMFRCPVISRKHANIVFSTTGPAYIIDLNSHHGTHILKPGETLSKPLKGQTPVTLCNGDIVTFGKSVGRDDSVVRPVTARVQLMRDYNLELFREQSRSATPAQQRFSDPVNNVPSSTPADRSAASDRSSPKCTSGRYGLYSPLSSASSDSSSQSNEDQEHDSDVEEVEKADIGSQSLADVVSQSRNEAICNSNSMRAHLPSFKSLDWRRFLPPVRTPLLSFKEVSKVIDVDNDEEASSIRDDSESEDDHQPAGMRSSSPLDKDRSASSSSIPTPFAGEPQVIGAYPIPRVSCPFSPPMSPAPDVVFADVTSPFLFAEENRVSSTVSSRQPSVQPLVLEEDYSAFDNSVQFQSAGFSDVRPLASTVFDVVDLSQDKSRPSTPVLGSEELVTSDVPSYEPEPESVKRSSSPEMESLRSSLAQFDEGIRDLKLRLNSHITSTKDAFTTNDERISGMDIRVTSLSDRLEMAAVNRVTAVETRIQGIRADVAARVAETNHAATSNFLERGDVISSLDAIKVLVEEMRTLRDTTSAQFASELEALRALRAQVTANIQEQGAAQREDVSYTSKRKRRDSISEDEDVSPATVVTKIGVDAADTRPSKRVRVVSRVVQTASAITLGAVATWSALAFT